MTTHRGLSAVVGTVFLIAVVVGALSYVTYSIDMMGDFSESLIAEESRQRDKQSEAYEITSIDVTPANKLDGVIKNTGEIPVELTSLYIDEQGVNDVVQKFALDTPISPGNTVDLIDLIDYTIDPTKGYNVKVVSSRGEVNSIYINSASSESLLMQIRAIPEYVPSEFTTTILYSVINNMSNNNVLYNITPQLTVSDVVGVDVGTIRSGPTPTSYPVLNPGDVAVFEYVVTMIGDVSDSSMFNATISNSVPGNSVTTTSTVREVTVATEAGTALESFGLASELSANSAVLLFHDEFDLSPNSEYHMDGSDPSGSGSTGILETAPLEFITVNVTSATTTEDGTWNIVLPYYNELVPPGITSPSFAFMMECDNCPSGGDTYDSTGNISGDDFEESGNPTHFTSGGPDDKGYFSYDGNDRHHAEWDADSDYLTHQDISSNPVTTAVWFRIPATSDNYMPIVRWGDENDGNDDEYEIALGDGTSGNHADIVYRYATDIDNDETRCIAPGTYDDNLWHFAVGTRTADDDCSLYIDGVLADGTPECINGPCSGSNQVDVGSRDDVFIGFNGQSDYLTGDVAMFMHWNGVSLDAADILELNNTNYGTNATRAQMLIEKTNSAGTDPETIYSDTFSFDFHDVSLKGEDESERIDHNYSDTNWEKYTHANFTMTTLTDTTLAAGDRLKLTMTWDGDSENLPFHFRYDDPDTDFGSLPLGPAYMQTPPTDPSWPTFLSIDKDGKVEYVVFNNGPTGAWLTYQGTRFIITTLDSQDSYGGLVDQINSTSVNEDQDSIYIADQEYALIRFHILGNPPQINTPGSERAPAGLYNAAVFMSGFDEVGEAFLRSVKLGLVRVY